MESKYVIGLTLQGSEHKRIQKFGLGAALKRNVQTHWLYVSSADTKFSNRLAKNLKKERLVMGF